MDGETEKEKERERIEIEKKRWGDRTEEWLCDAAMRGDVGSLKEIIAKDEYILDKVVVGGFKGKNPLHVAISTGQGEFVQELLTAKPELAEVLDTKLGMPLHIASSKGHLEIVKHLVSVSPGMCMARNREGNNPLHIAAMKGKVEVLKVLLRTSPQAAQVRVDQGYTILHLCVNCNQLESLKGLLDSFREDPGFVASTDTYGNNILHLAVLGNRYEIVEHVLRNTKINVNARNGGGWTAVDVYYSLGLSQTDSMSESDRMREVLCKAGAKESNKLFFPFDPYWQKKTKDTLMIVSSLMATMAFQVGVYPPGGVWQDKSSSGDHVAHVAGKAITAKKKVFGYIGAGISWLAIMTMAFAYTFSIIVVSPTEEYKSVSRAILVTVIVWAVVISLLHVAPYMVQEGLADVIDNVLTYLAIFFLVICLFNCWDSVHVCKEPASGNKASEGTVQSPRDTASTADPNAVGEENDASV